MANKEQNIFRLPLPFDELVRLNGINKPEDFEIMDIVAGIIKLCNGKSISNMTIALSIIEACIETCPNLYSPTCSTSNELFGYQTEARKIFTEMINEKLKEEIGVQ